MELGVGLMSKGCLKKSKLCLDDPSTTSGIVGPYINPMTGRRVLSAYVSIMLQDGQRALILKSTPIEDFYNKYSPAFYNNAGFCYAVNESGDIILRFLHPASNKSFVNIYGIRFRFSCGKLILDGLSQENEGRKNRSDAFSWRARERSSLLYSSAFPELVFCFHHSQ